MNKKQKNQPVEPVFDTEAMRKVVIDLELKARKWRAEHDIMVYMMEVDKLTPVYREFMDAQKKAIEGMISNMATETASEEPEEKQTEENVEG